jgi:hypothetical protein
VALLAGAAARLATHGRVAVKTSFYKALTVHFMGGSNINISSTVSTE